MVGYKDYGYTDLLPTYNYAMLLHPLLAWLNKNKNACILDYGCGNGALTGELIDRGFNCFGIDFSASGIELAQSKYPGRFAVQNSSDDCLPVEIQSHIFDTILSTEVIEHVYDPTRFVQNCKTILSKNGGGQLIISTPYHGYFKNLAISLMGMWDKHADPLWTGGHIKFWSRKSLTKLLESEGFRITRFIGCGRIPYFWKSMIIIAQIGDREITYEQAL